MVSSTLQTPATDSVEMVMRGNIIWWWTTLSHWEWGAPYVYIIFKIFFLSFADRITSHKDKVCPKLLKGNLIKSKVSLCWSCEDLLEQKVAFMFVSTCELFPHVHRLVWSSVCLLSQRHLSNYPQIQRQKGSAALTGGASFPECSRELQTAITPLNRPIKMIHITFSTQ